ncbi:MAG: CPBP family intramembrane glutamic endopeptidase [Candidatus Acidiferrales bacterium]
METNPSSLTEPQPNPRRPIAPVWHTACLLGFILITSVFEYFRNRQLLGNPALQEHRVIYMYYAYALAFEWILAAYVVWGIRRSGVIRLPELIGGRWNSEMDALRDAGIAALGWGCVLVMSVGIQIAIHGGSLEAIARDAEKSRATARFILPRTGLQLIIWILVAVSAGICEELVFRGYLQEIFKRWTGMAWLAVVLQALIFGSAHSYQGISNMAVITGLGLIFGFLAYWRRSLRPGMILHTGIDSLSGLAYFVLQRIGRF